MGTSTDPILGLTLVTAGTKEKVNVTTFLDDNFKKIAAAVGLRPAKSATQTISNNAAEVVLESFTIPAGTAALGSTWKMSVWGTADNIVTAVPTITLRLRLGGLAGSLIASLVITCPAGAQTNKEWSVDADLMCTLPGAAATWRGRLLEDDNIQAVAHGGVAANAAAVTLDSTINRDMVITAQWSAASTSNVLRADAGNAYRITNA